MRITHGYSRPTSRPAMVSVRVTLPDGGEQVLLDALPG